MFYHIRVPLMTSLRLNSFMYWIIPEHEVIIKPETPKAKPEVFVVNNH